MRTVRLAVLLCDDFIVKVFKSKGEHANIYRQFLSSSLELITSEVTFTLDAYDVIYEEDYPPDDVHYDGLLISGRVGFIKEPTAWADKLIEYTKRILTEKPSLKIFGICFGHQVIAKALGSPVETGELEISVTPIHLTHLGKALFHDHKIQLQLFHHKEVTKCPPCAHLLGSSDAVHNQGFVLFHPDSAPSPLDLKSDALCIHLKSIHVLTFQGHPEMTESIMRMLIEKNADRLPQDLVNDALDRVGLPTDAIDKVGRVMWGVLGVTSKCWGRKL